MKRSHQARIGGVFICLFLFAACDDDSDTPRPTPTGVATKIPTSSPTTSMTATPTPTAAPAKSPTPVVTLTVSPPPTPVDTPTVSPRVTITATITPTPQALSYVLTEGSQLSYKVGTLPDSIESLVGSMELLGGEQSDQLFDFDIINFDLRSEHFHLVGNEGSFRATMQDGETLVSMQILTNVDGSDLALSGRGSAESVSGFPPAIRGLEIFGGDEARPGRFHLILYIFAEPLR